MTLVTPQPAPARPRRKRTTLERRDDLLDAAVEVFRARGLETTTVADIAAAAGVAKGTFYLYFETKEQLVSELRARLADELLARTEAFAAQLESGDWWGVVDAYVDSAIGHLLEHRDLIVVLASAISHDKALSTAAEAERRITRVVADGIAAGVAAGAFAVDDAELTGLLLQRAVFSTIEHVILYGIDVEPDRLSRAVHTLVRRALAPAPAPVSRRRVGPALRGDRTSRRGRARA